MILSKRGLERKGVSRGNCLYNFSVINVWVLPVSTKASTCIPSTDRRIWGLFSSPMPPQHPPPGGEAAGFSSFPGQELRQVAAFGDSQNTNASLHRSKGVWEEAPGNL